MAEWTLLLETKNEKHAIAFADCNQTPDDVSEWDGPAVFLCPPVMNLARGSEEQGARHVNLNSDVRERCPRGVRN